MSNTYLVRAKLEHGWPDGGLPSKLPIPIGAFLINQSPNINLYARNLGYGPSIDDDPPKENSDYPVSNLYIDCNIQIPEKQPPFTIADDILSYLEILFRLFQPGRVYFRKHRIRLIEDVKGDEQFISNWNLPTPRHPRPKPAPFNGSIGYDLDEMRIMLKFPIGVSSEYGYDLSDAKLVDFKAFFSRFWETIRDKPQPLDVAVNRFSSSYDKQTLADRLIDLMIATEALLGAKAKGTSQIAERFACILFPPGLAREEAAKQIKRDSGYYNERSRLSHGDKLDTELTKSEVENFEDLVRRLIIKHLEHGERLSSLTSKEDIDKLLWKK